jgi:antitoxin VapB
LLKVGLGARRVVICLARRALSKTHSGAAAVLVDEFDAGFNQCAPPFHKRAQSMQILREFELPGEDAIMRKQGQKLIIEPAPPKSLLAVLATLPTLDEEFPPIRDLPAEPIDL